ncbi:efflux RND transporter permease subunit [Escherichia coli]
MRHTGFPYAAGRPAAAGRFSGDYGQRLSGASPETMASSVATPLERSLGRIAGVSEMTSSSSLEQHAYYFAV